MAIRTPPPRSAGRWAATLAIGAVGGLIASRVGLPLPWLMGALIATALAAGSGLRVAGGRPAFPETPREVCVPVVGVLIGATFTPATMAGVLDWWPGLIAVALFVPAALLTNFLLFHRVAGFSRPTAFFGGMPGGLIDAIELGVENGADPRAITVLQFARIVVTVVTVPLLFAALEGQAVGSAAGATVGGGAPVGLRDALILFSAGLFGYLAAKRLHVPAGRIVGPIFASAFVHGVGLTEAAPPPALVSAAQLVIGVGLGLRFTGLTGRELRRYFSFSMLSVASMLALGGVFAGLTATLGVAPADIMLLCFAPGGLVEMGLIALSLNANPIFVTAHHLVRILASVIAGVGIWRRVGRG